MKIFSRVLVVLVLLFSTSSQAQVYKDGWGLGFGFTSPRYLSDVTGEFFDFGGHLFVQKDFDELHSIRFGLEFLDFTAQDNPVTNTAVLIGTDYVYRFEPEDVFKMYFGTGAHLVVQSLKNANNRGDKTYYGDVAISFLLGASYNINKEWDLRGEFKQVTVSSDKFDGLVGPVGGLLGGTLDSYISLALGASYYWDRGEASTKFDMPSGMTTQYVAGEAKVDYDKIKQMIEAAQKPAPEVDYAKIEEMLDRKLKGMKNDPTVIYQQTPGDNSPKQLVGINFDNGSAELRPDAFVLLAQNVMVLTANKDMKIEIGGHTDNSGSEAANKKLSEMRAEVVKKYLVAKGISASRISTKSYGSSSPISDNESESGKALNRRAELRIVN